MELILQGEKYIGRFDLNKHTYQQWTGSEYTEALHDFYEYIGEGQIENGETKAKLFFKISTKGVEDCYKFSEEELMFNPDVFSHLIPEKRKHFNDLFLEDIVSQSKTQTDAVIPSVVPNWLNLSELKRQGICYWFKKDDAEKQNPLYWLRENTQLFLPI